MAEEKAMITFDRIQDALTALGLDSDLCTLRTVVISLDQVRVTRWPDNSATSETTVYGVAYRKPAPPDPKDYPKPPRYDCAYRRGMGKCSFGDCSTEPRCITDDGV